MEKKNFPLKVYQRMWENPDKDISMVANQLSKVGLLGFKRIKVLYRLCSQSLKD